MRVLVAGATGVLGRPLVRRLLEHGHEVAGMTRSEERADVIRGAGAEPVVCDVLDSEALMSAVAEIQPETVIHEVTNIPPRLDPRKYKRQFTQTNRLRREGTRNLIAAASSAGARRLLAQSVAFAYAPTGSWVKDEDAPLDLDAKPPMDEVLGAIAALEEQVLAAGGIVLRHGFLYGPGTEFEADGFFAELVRKRRFPVIGSGEGRWPFIHVEDAVAATVAALDRGAAGIYNVVDDDPAPANEWVPAYAKAVGAKPPRRVPLWLGRLLGGRVAAAGMTVQRGASNAKARRELDWAPEHPSWRDGFRLTAGT